ncbi:hypothetical protein K437DRAFT_48247 [Tilletiaria anomala UBC 951]|uniref:Uncharacterized protein n=1 Tax=Tilletiaria anomala (strain ATCC 24038 / CBS 436.72 / UBC 951) TaxID=1037660 RepID=A0A066V5X5_TILAU|nr:uncharacterized protein K437DRAFT_48247 [Tilletiaria anomala UBC 951]KDN36831.1 hypothetical protein K437DRAFT_48247 [Tilletiaria anomala UBC 951]
MSRLLPSNSASSSGLGPRSTGQGEKPLKKQGAAPLHFPPLSPARATAAQTCLSSPHINETLEAHVTSPAAREGLAQSTLSKFRERKQSDARSDISSIASSDSLPGDHSLRTQRHTRGSNRPPSLILASASSHSTPTVQSTPIEPLSKEWSTAIPRCTRPASALAETPQPNGTSETGSPAGKLAEVPVRNIVSLEPGRARVQVTIANTSAHADAKLQKAAPAMPDDAHLALLSLMKRSVEYKGQSRGTPKDKSMKKVQNQDENPRGANRERHGQSGALGLQPPHQVAAAARRDDALLEQELLRSAGIAGQDTSKPSIKFAGRTSTPETPKETRQQPEVLHTALPQLGLRQRRMDPHHTNAVAQPQHPHRKRVMEQLESSNYTMKSAEGESTESLRKKRAAMMRPYSRRSSEVTALARSSMGLPQRSPGGVLDKARRIVPSRLAAAVSLQVVYNGNLLHPPYDVAQRQGSSLSQGWSTSLLCAPLRTLRGALSSAFVLHGFDGSVPIPDAACWLVERGVAIAGVAQSWIGVIAESFD